MRGFRAVMASLVIAVIAQIGAITVNDLVNPIAVNTSTPIFGWSVNNTSARGASFGAVQIQVRATDAQNKTLWDSGKVETNETELKYSGTRLLARHDYGFRIRLNETYGCWTDWATGSFGTGIFVEADWSSAQWIGGTNPINDQPLFRTSFSVPQSRSKSISSARLFITGLGVYEAYINGVRVGDLQLAPGWTTYSERVFYDTYNVTGQISQGNNTVGIAVGRYWFGGIYDWGPAADYGAWDGNMRAKAQLLITYSDRSNQTVVTDSSWKTHIGGTICNVTSPDYEIFDARNESSNWTTTSFDASSWSDVIVQTPPYTMVESTPIEPVRIIQTYSAVAITNPATDVWVYDFGQNMAGVGVLTVNEPAGTVVSMHYGEKLTSGRVIDEGDRHQVSLYISAGAGSETWKPHFTYYGFQYIELSGVTNTPDAGTVVAQRLHSDVKNTGSFTTSDTLLNWIYNATLQTVLNNVMGHPTDGSDVEKLPWTADAALMTETAFSAFNLKAVYTKWLQDITDSQLSTGNIESFAPSPLEQTTSPSAAWGNSYPETAWQLYRYYGDVNMLHQFYPTIKAYVDYELNSRGGTGLVGAEAWGDWITLSTNDKTLVGTAYLYRSITRLTDIASVLGFYSDVTTYTTFASAVNASFHSAFYQPATEDYRNNSTNIFVQTDNVLPVAFEMTNSVRRQSIMDKVAADVVSNSNHLATGILGTKWLLPTLTEYGYTELAYLLATQTTYPSWGYWKSTGATTLWEGWPVSARSHGHQFLGTVVDWFYQYLAGIKIAEAGFVSVSISPYVPENLSSACGTIQTARGPVTSSWTNTTSQFDLNVEIPSGSAGLLHLPVTKGQSVYESGMPAASAKGATFVGSSNDRTSFELLSGSYKFTVK